MRNCNYCTRPVRTEIVANNQIYCGKLCAGLGLIKEEDEICSEFSESLEGAIDSIFHEVPLGIPVKVRWSDALEFDQKAPDGFEYHVIPIDDWGTPDWIPTHGKQWIGLPDDVMDGLLRLRA